MFIKFIQNYAYKQINCHFVQKKKKDIPVAINNFKN